MHPLAIFAALLASGAGAAPDDPLCFQERATITAESSDRVVRGTRRDDVIIAIGRSKEVLSGAGEDRICTGTGRDRIESGPGDDLVSTGDGADTLDGGDGNDRLQAGDGDDVFRAGPTIGSGGVDKMVGGDGTDLADFGGVEGPLTVKLVAGGGGFTPAYHYGVPRIEDLIGTEQGDTITASDGPNQVLGLGGDDEIFGREGRDELVGGDGIDSVDGGPSSDRCEGETLTACERKPRAAPATATPTVSRSADDPGQLQLTIASSPGESEYIVVRPSNGSAQLLPDPDRAPPTTPWTVTAADCSQDQQTKIVTCTAAVTSLLVVGGDGDEGVLAKKVSFGVVGFAGGGSDFLGGGLADDTLDGGPGADLLRGDLGRDSLLGGLDDDVIFGGPGADRLVGSAGRDRMFGEGQADRLSARDEERDGRIDCGPGSDRRERATVDAFDPVPKSC